MAEFDPKEQGKIFKEFLGNLEKLLKKDTSAKDTAKIQKDLAATIQAFGKESLDLYDKALKNLKEKDKKNISKLEAIDENIRTQIKKAIDSSKDDKTQHKDLIKELKRNRQTDLEETRALGRKTTLLAYITQENKPLGRFLTLYRAEKTKEGKTGFSLTALFKAGTKSLFSPLTALKGLSAGLATFGPLGLVLGATLMDFTEGLEENKKELDKERKRAIEAKIQEGKSVSDAVKVLAAEIAASEGLSKPEELKLAEQLEKEMDGVSKIIQKEEETRTRIAQASIEKEKELGIYKPEDEEESNILNDVFPALLTNTDEQLEAIQLIKEYISPIPDLFSVTKEQLEEARLMREDENRNAMRLEEVQTGKGEEKKEGIFGKLKNIFKTLSSGISMFVGPLMTAGRFLISLIPSLAALGPALAVVATAVAAFAVGSWINKNLVDPLVKGVVSEKEKREDAAWETSRLAMEKAKNAAIDRSKSDSKIEKPLLEETVKTQKELVKTKVEVQKEESKKVKEAETIWDKVKPKKEGEFKSLKEMQKQAKELVTPPTVNIPPAQIQEISRMERIPSRIEDIALTAFVNGFMA